MSFAILAENLSEGAIGSLIATLIWLFIQKYSQKSLPLASIEGSTKAGQRVLLSKFDFFPDKNDVIKAEPALIISFPIVDKISLGLYIIKSPLFWPFSILLLVGSIALIFFGLSLKLWGIFAISVIVMPLALWLYVTTFSAVFDDPFDRVHFIVSRSSLYSVSTNTISQFNERYLQGSRVEFVHESRYKLLPPKARLFLVINRQRIKVFEADSLFLKFAPHASLDDIAKRMTELIREYASGLESLQNPSPENDGH